MGPLLSARNVDVSVVVKKPGIVGRATTVKIIDDVSLDLIENRTYGLVGESGSGKSTLGRALIGAQPGVSGTIDFNGIPLPASDRDSERTLRSQVQMVFQDPLGAFDPRQTVRESIVEALRTHRRLPSAPDPVLRELMSTVGLPVEALDVSPRQLSGGQRQRAVIARAISLSPKFIVADEPFAALDVTTQARVVAVMAKLQREEHLTQLIISHDLSMIDLICDDVYVMYLGSIVESGSSRSLAQRPSHPYTIALRSAVPVPDPILEKKRSRILLSGDPPGPAARPAGCPFHPRCPIALPKCAEERPLLKSVEADHHSACHRSKELLAGEVSLESVGMA